MAAHDAVVAVLGGGQFGNQVRQVPGPVVLQGVGRADPVVVADAHELVMGEQAAHGAAVVAGGAARAGELGQVPQSPPVRWWVTQLGQRAFQCADRAAGDGGQPVEHDQAPDAAPAGRDAQAAPQLFIRQAVDMSQARDVGGNRLLVRGPHGDGQPRQPRSHRTVRFARAGPVGFMPARRRGRGGWPEGERG